MSRLGFIAISVLSLVADGTWAASHAGKISAPVQITIAAEDALTPGRLADFTVTAIALADTPAVSISVDLPDDLAVFSGDTEWQGPMQRSETRILTFTLRIPEHGAAAIHARALAHWGETVFGTQAALDLGANAKPSSPVLPPAHDGIRDFPLD